MAYQKAVITKQEETALPFKKDSRKPSESIVENNNTETTTFSSASTPKEVSTPTSNPSKNNNNITSNDETHEIKRYEKRSSGSSDQQIEPPTIEARKSNPAPIHELVQDKKDSPREPKKAEKMGGGKF